MNIVITAVPKPAAKKAKAAEVDAETLAAQVFGDEPEATKAVAERQMPVECLNCNHKWTEPESKAGKNVVCPECRTRMKVPELKAPPAPLSLNNTAPVGRVGDADVSVTVAVTVTMPL